MARPSRCRRICLEPQYDTFVPGGVSDGEPIVLTVDEYEAVRLIDFEKTTHEQCARQMGISRTTVTEMYETARFKIADCLVNGKPLRITGGNYRLCEGSARPCCGKPCRKGGAGGGQADYAKGASHMKIAVTYENGNVFQHFGHTEQFKLYDIANNEIAGTQIVSAAGSGHGALAGFLTGLHVDVLICGGIGAGAQNALAEARIQFYGGVSGAADDAVNALLAGQLVFNPQVRCDHHDHHGEGHHCGESKHGCAGSGGGCR